MCEPMGCAAHAFVEDKMWNGYPAKLVDARGAHKNGIEHFADKMWVGASSRTNHYKKKARLADGYGITVNDLE